MEVNCNTATYDKVYYVDARLGRLVVVRGLLHVFLVHHQMRILDVSLCWLLRVEWIWLTSLILTNLLLKLLSAWKMLHLVHLMHVHPSLNEVVSIKDELKQSNETKEIVS